MYAILDESNVVIAFEDDGDVFVGDGPYELLAEDDCYKYKWDGTQLIERTQEERDRDWSYPTKEEVYVAKVEALVRKRYRKVSDELALLRQRDTKQEEYNAYYNYVEQCKEQARKEVYGDELPTN